MKQTPFKGLTSFASDPSS